MVTIEEMANEIERMEKALYDVRHISPIKDYDKLCTSFTSFVDKFNQYVKENGP